MSLDTLDAAGVPPGSPDVDVRDPHRPRSPHAPVPVGAPLVGMATAAVAMVAGLWLILAPRAFDYRHGHDGSGLPAASVVDLVSGVLAVAIGLAALLLFGIAVRRRLRAAGVLARPRIPSPAGPYEDTAHLADRSSDREAEPEPIPTVSDAAGPTSVPAAAGDLHGLRELLAPLVTALAEDLRSRQDPRGDGMPPRGRTGGAS